MKSFIHLLLAASYSAAERAFFNGWFTMSIGFPRAFWLSRDWSGHDAEAISDAANTWNMYAGDPVLAVFLSEFVEVVGINGRNSIVKDSSVFGAYTNQYTAITEPKLILFDSDITLGARLSGNALYNVALHEFGHCLGLLHSQEPHSIMNYTLVLNQSYAPIAVDRVFPTRYDIEYVQKSLFTERPRRKSSSRTPL